jgi:uncharacterized membrane protein YidH (DUF202 family)
MALATRPKPKTAHRKRVAQHHKHTPHYLKTYWPYLPALAVIGAGLMANKWLEQSDSLLRATANLQGVIQPTRIEAITGDTNGLALAIVLIITGLAAGVLLFQHWFRIQRVLNRGEAFAVKHPLIDLVLVVIITAGVLLSRQVI